MPRPPLLPTIDWPALLEQSRSFDAWLSASSSSNCPLLKAQVSKLSVPASCSPQLTALSSVVHVIAIAETWCGDVVRHVPVLEALVESSEWIRSYYIKREDDLDLFARYLTNGGEAIPRFIFLNSSLIECGNWGPMPERCKELIARGKALGDVGSARARVSELYEQDADCIEVMEELTALIDIAGSRAI